MKHRRKSSQIKYKKLAAAVAGAALITSGLPGLASASQSAEPKEIAQNYQSAPVVASNQTTEAHPAENFRDPVQTVVANAKDYGIETTNATFSLVSQSASKAIVKVRSSSQTYKVELSEDNGNWIIDSVQTIGDAYKSIRYLPIGFLLKTNRSK